MLSSGSDLLTAVTDGTVSTGSKQNNTVSYDEMGNPTRYFGATMTWAGKQLKYWGKSGKYVNFAYNEDGIRTLKNSNDVVTNYYYNGSLLIGMTVGSGSSTRILRFSYDSSGSVVAVDYSTDNGSTFNTYYYLRNAQNDIVKLIDNSGSTVVEYCYDSWGKLLSTSGSLASTLGKNNPFRYRGYVYDEETGFYYLQSRYYNPEVGRFISSDVLLSTGQGVLGHNAYAYCLNNPVNMSDSCGTAPLKQECLPDRTKEVLCLLLDNFVTAKKWSAIPGYAQIQFYQHVRSRGDWDYKYHLPDWAKDVSGFSAFGLNMTAADLGNLNYGFIGSTLGFSRKTLLVAAGFVALRENGDNDGCEYYYDGKDDNFFINFGVGIHYFMEPASFASGEFFDWMVNAGINGRLLLTIYKITKELRGSL